MPARAFVTLPHMFRCFLVPEPRVNPSYNAVKLSSEKWLARTCSFSPKMQRKINICDFSYFCSIAAPEAPEEKLRTVCDWGNWVFPFDDMFDSGDLRSDIETSSYVLDSLMASMLGRRFNGNKLPVVQAHDDIFRRISEESSTGVQRRFARAMELYTSGVVQHVKTFTSNHIPSAQEMLQTRQLSVGVAPLYHLVEYAHSLHLPDEIFEAPVIQTLERLGADFVILSNDILSYRKEENEGCPFNMVAACRMGGQSAQEAFNTIGALLEERYIQWDEVVRRLPSWGADVDPDVRRYIKGIQDVVQANISWSFRSQRYLGSHAAEVRRTRRIDVMVNPPYLELGTPEIEQPVGSENPIHRQMLRPLGQSTATA